MTGDAMIEVRESIPYKGIRKAVGKHMEASLAIPLHYQGIYADVTDLLEFRKKVNEEHGSKVTVNDFIIRAVALSLQKTPIMNSSLNADKTAIEVYQPSNISVMTASEKGLVAPVIKDAQDKSVFQISEEMRELVSRANAGKLRPDDISGGTFGVTNIGKLNSYDSVPRPLPPQSSIMTACTAKKMAVVLDDGKDTIAARMMMKLVIGSDHRVTDGVPLANFINDVKRYLEDPASLLK